MIRKMNAKANYTLEAAVITAITMFIICTAILVSFNIHDKTVMGADAATAILENIPGRDEKEHQGAAQAMSDAVKGALASDIIMADISLININESDGAYTADLQGSFSWLLAPIMEYVNENMSNPEAKVKVSNLNGRKILLKYKLAKDLMQTSGQSTGGKEK